MFLFLSLSARVSATDVVLLSQVHTARTLECGEDLIVFDKGGESGDGSYYGTASCWYYLRTAYSGSPLHVRVQATLASNCSLTFYSEYPNDDQATSPSFPTNYPGQHGLFRATTGTVDTTFVSTTGKLSLHFFNGSASQTRIANFRIYIWISDTSEVYQITHSNITSNSAQLSWLDSSDATSWTVRYGTSMSDLNQSLVVNTPTATLSPLTPNMPYYVRVYNNARTTEATTGYCTPNSSYFLTQGSGSVPVGCIGDFTSLESDNVICTYGHYDNPDEAYGPVSDRITVIDSSEGCDPIIGDSLRMVPEGSEVSVRLGNSSAGNEAESVIYRFQIDTSQYDLLLLRYAAVLQNPNGHPTDIQPRLSLQILRADGTEINDDCYKSEFVASSVLTTGSQWHNHGGASGSRVLWHDWTAVGVDLSPLHGEVLYVKLTTRDCNENAATHEGAHFGYAYLTLQCSRKQIDYRGCGTETPSTLVAPDGFVYDWHERGNTATLSTEREFTLPAVSDAVYECTMTFRGSNSEECSFSMTVNPAELVRIPHAGFETSPLPSGAGNMQFVNTSYLSRDDEGEEPLSGDSGLSYQWNFGDGFTSSETNPTHQFPSSAHDRTYTVVLTAVSESGCQSEYQSTVLVYGTGEPETGELLSADCLVPDTARPWADPELEWTSSNLLSVHTIPLVGDLNGDGHPEIVCFDATGSVVINQSQNHKLATRLAIFDGVTKQRLTLSEPVMKNHAGSNVYADEFSVAPYGILRTQINGIDTGLIVVAARSSSSAYSNSDQYYLHAFNIHGENVWSSNVPYGSSRGSGSSLAREYPVAIGFADFNSDGYPEVYVRNKVFDAATGVLLTEAHTNNAGESWSHKCGSLNYYGILSVPFAADLTGDGSPELILGNEAYHVEITNRTDSLNNSATLVASHTPPQSLGNDGHTQVADFNGDGHLDVLVSVRNAYSNSASVSLYVWDVYNDVVSAKYSIPLNNNGKGIPLIGDIDNDGQLEVVIQAPASSGGKIRALRYNAQSMSFSEVWATTFTEDSWSNTMTMFDFNGDGEKELLFSARNALYVLRGADGTTLSTLTHGEVTIMDYPVIADIDNDGSVEILTIDTAIATPSLQGRLHVFRSSGQPWSAGRAVWNQYMYNATCVNNDLTIPSYPTSNALTLTDPESVSRQPFNNSLQQVPLLDLYGRQSQYAADLTVNVGNGAYESDGLLRIPMTICNQGEVTVRAPFSVAIYSGAYRGEVVDVVQIMDTIGSGGCLDVMAALPMSQLCGLDSSELILAVNDNGGGVAQNGNYGQQYECDTVNNFIAVTIPACKPDPVDSVQTVTACDSYTWPLNGVTYHASTNTDTVTRYGASDVPDTIVTLHLTINYSSGTDIVVTSCGSFEWYTSVPDRDSNTYHGTFTEDNDEAQVFLTNAFNCDSVLTLHLTIVQNSTGDTVAAVCNGSFDWYEHIGMNTSQDVTHTFEAADRNGCDSTVTLHLRVGESVGTDTSVTACLSFEWWRTGETYETSDTYFHTYVDSAGCESVDTLHLEVLQNVTVHLADTVCDSLNWYGEIIRESQTVEHTTVTALGCDSTVVLALTVKHATYGDTSAVACVTFDWYEYQGLDNEEPVSHTIQGGNAFGCDSIVTLHLSLISITNFDTAVSACGGFDWYGEHFDASEVSTVTVVHTIENGNQYGCDSTVTLYLTLYPEYLTEFWDTICEGESYNFYGVERTSTATYTVHMRTMHGCDSAFKLHLLVRPHPELAMFYLYDCEFERCWVAAHTDATSYYWSATPGGHQLVGHETDEVISLHPLDTTLVSLTVDYATGRSCPSSSQVEVYPVHRVVAGMECHPEVLTPDNRSLIAHNTSTGYSDYMWYVDGAAWGNDPYISCTADADAGQIVLTMVAYNDICADTLERIIKVIEEVLYVPNVFTPSLSTNSSFRAFGKGIIEFRMLIFNREGVQVFESDQMEKEWDGTCNGEDCIQGNYVYRIDYRGECDPDGWKTKTGSILLLR